MFGLDYSLHARFLQVVMNGVRMERLVDDIGECFGHLDSTLCLVSGNKVDSMVNIGRGKLGWTTPNRLLEVRTLLGTKSGDGGKAYTSARCNGANGMTRIKL